MTIDRTLQMIQAPEERVEFWPNLYSYGLSDLWESMERAVGIYQIVGICQICNLQTCHSFHTPHSRLKNKIILKLRITVIPIIHMKQLN